MPRAEGEFAETPLCLIQVPRVVPPPRSRLRAEPPWPGLPRTQTVRKTRRRLRREFRLAVVTMFVLLPVPLALAVTHWPAAASNRPTSSRMLAIPAPGGNAALGAFHAPVWLSVEPAGAAVDGQTETPVVFPGYLLPDDSHEESTHEGS
ncbi:MAG: hypothetical protein ACP5XB_20020 [Isosphaeraceae bacterium]